METQVLPQVRIREWKEGETLDNLTSGDVVRFTMTHAEKFIGRFDGLYKGKLDGGFHMVYSRLSERALCVWEINNGSIVMGENLRYSFDTRFARLAVLDGDISRGEFECVNKQLKEAEL